MNNNKNVGKIPMWRKLGFSAFQLSNVMATLVTTWLMYYYTTFLKIPIVIVTLMFTVAKIIGAILTPIYGYISDRLYQTKFGRKHGRRKSLFLIGIPLKALTYIFMWIPGMSKIFYFIFFLLYYMVTPMLSTSQLTLTSEMSEDSKQRAQLIGFNQFGSATSGIFASLFITWIFKIFGQDSLNSFIASAIIYDVIGTIMLIIFYNCVYERPIDESTILETEKIGIWSRLVNIFWNFFSAIRIKSYWTYVLMWQCEELFRTIRGDINTYFIIFVLLLTPADVAVSTSVGYIFGILFLLFFMWLQSRTNGMISYRVGAWSGIIVFVLIGILVIMKPSHLSFWWIVAMIALNFGITGVVNSSQYIFTFLPDIDEIVTSKRREGEYAGINTTLDTLLDSLFTLIIGIVLQATGFQEGAKVQSSITINALFILYTVIPIVLLLLGILFSHICKLNVKNHNIVLAEINRLRNGGSMTDVDPKTKKVIEGLTGFKYENCWGNNNVMDYTKNKNIRK
ncbi:MFS transporter [Lactobacillus hamsteri]|nr:MFS transporter [Lactobacillus hamsteri]